MMKAYRAVIIGDNAHGAFGHHLDLAFSRTPRVEVVAIADPVEKGLKEGQIELKERRTGAVTKLSPADVASRLKELLAPTLA